MSIYSNRPEVQLALPNNAPAPSRTLVRPVTLAPGLEGRLFTTEAGEYGKDSVGLRVTGRGHWYRTDDDHGTDCAPERRCRGCGTTAPFGYLLDSSPCSHAASQQDIASALFESVPRPAPAPMRSHRIRFIRTAVAA